MDKQSSDRNLIPTEGKFAKLGVNIDHVATLRQLRGTPYPDIRKAAALAISGGAHQLTVHLREDRRHIQESDVEILLDFLRNEAQRKIPLNLEMSVAKPIVKKAIQLKPDWACLVPEKRREVTTEGGLDLKKNSKVLVRTIESLKKVGIQVSLFIEPNTKVVAQAGKLGVDAVELHTGKYCRLTQREDMVSEKTAGKISRERDRIIQAATKAQELGLRAHAGHGIDYSNIRDLARLKRSDGQTLIEEFNIGHAIVCHAVEVGLERAVREMASEIIAP